MSFYKKLNEDNHPQIDIEEIIKIYMVLINKGVDITFNKSTQCNSLFIKALVSNEDEFETVMHKRHFKF